MMARACVLAVGWALWCQVPCSAGEDFYDETVPSPLADNAE